MQTVETLNEGLKRAYTLTIPAKDILARVDAEISRAAPEIRMPGFRPGKVPANLIRKMHGPAMEQEALNTAVQQSVQALIAEQGLRPAMQPSVELGEGYAAGQDAEVKVALEILPDVPAPAIDGLVLERLTVEPGEAEIDEQVQRLASQQKAFDPAPEGHAAAMGDTVVLDFVGKVDGVAFDGGTGEGMAVELGSGRLIPGFEDQLEGIVVGEERVLNVTFPEDYNVATLKGKPATFEVKATEVKTPKDASVDEDFAKALGLESLDQLRGLFRGQVEQELNGLTRTHMKRKLLDQLATGHDFPVPPSMVEAEFQQIWSQLEHEASHETDVEAAKAEMEGDRDDYRSIAERRVRLGLLLSEIGRLNGVEVSNQEMQRLAQQAAQQYDPKDRERFLQYIQQDPMAAAQLRAPLYEDKVVDFLFGKATITDRATTREELEAAIEADADGDIKPHVHGPDCGHDHGDHGDDGAHDHAGHDHVLHDAGDGGAEAASSPVKKKPVKKKADAAEGGTPAADAVVADADPVEGEADAAKPKKKAAPKKKADAEA